MTQKFEFIATRTIEKPALKSSTYYASVDRGARDTTDQHPDVVDQPSGFADSVDPLAGGLIGPAENSELTSVEKKEEEGALESVDDVVPAEAVDVSQAKNDKLSEKFRQWQQDQLDSDFEWSSSKSPKSDSPPRQIDLGDVGRREDGLKAVETREDQLYSEVAVVAEGEPTHGAERASLDITDDILERNLTAYDVSDMFDDAVETSSRASDLKDEVDLSPMVERNWPAEGPHDAKIHLIDQLDQRVGLGSSRGTMQDDILPGPVESPELTSMEKDEEKVVLESVDSLVLEHKEPETGKPSSEKLDVEIERKSSSSSSEETVREVIPPHKEAERTGGTAADREESESGRLSPDVVRDSAVDELERRSSSSSSELTVLEISPLRVSTDEKWFDLREPASAEKSDETSVGVGQSPDAEGQRVSGSGAAETGDQLELSIRPDRLEFDGELAMMVGGGGGGVEQEVETTVSSRELETTDEIVVETKVTETRTVLMQLAETGSISVLETTELKTDTDMKETRKVREHDEVAVSHRSSRPAAADLIPLSPSPSPAGSLRSRTPDRQSPSADSAADVAGLGVDAGLYVAVCPYEPETDDVMSLHEGEYVELVDDAAADDWWLVRKSFDGREGYVPAQYLRDKHADDAMIEDEVARQMDAVDLDSSKIAPGEN